MKKFSITDIPEFSEKEKIVVIGIIGKSPYRYPNKSTPLLPSVECEENGIECFWDERNSLLYLHAVTYLDTRRLVELTSKLGEETKSSESDTDASHWLVAAGDLAAESCRAIALVFHLSQIVVLSSPTPVFDLGYLQLFKAIDAYRIELAPKVTEALSESGAGSVWTVHGRPCCPRLLFHFRRAPRPLRKNPASLKRLEHAVEDQLYYMLRKSRIITNVCAKSLFAIPKNEEFVYMSAEEEQGTARDVSSLVRGLVRLCAGEPGPGPPSDRRCFTHFLTRHVDIAFADGFDDNVGKYAMSTSFFELSSASSWRLAASALAPLYLSAEASAALRLALATDVRFSQARCAKVLPIAQAAYNEGLPAHYSSQHHAHKVAAAISVLETMGRGPVAAAARARLAAACEAAWRPRRLCEAPSLQDNPCIEPAHDNTKEHSSGVRYISACNCGRTKSSREDPYSVRRANYGFYASVAAECCNQLHAYTFPVFQPSTTSFRAAAVKGEGASQEDTISEGGSEGSQSAPEGAWSPGPELSVGEGEGDGEAEGEAGNEGGSSPRQYEMNTVREVKESEKHMTRQASTTEYLPGLLHTGSPAALLPRVAHWALTQLGASSLYSHSAGLPEALQPGLLHGHAALAPRLYPAPAAAAAAAALDPEPASASAWRGRGRGGKGATPHTIKIFIGYEYECPRGHRFMGGDSAGGGGAVALAAACPHRAKCVAQLMRVHLVTPKPPYKLALTPKVQLNPGGPIFIPQPESEPVIKLPSSSYWVLRLPYVYCDEKGPLPRPSLSHPGQLLPGHVALAD